jgi:opacity protein-like surface antigen
MIRCSLFLAILILFVASLAQAQLQRPPRRFQPRDGRWDLTLQTRYIGSKDYTGSGGSTASFEDDLGWGFGFGYNISSHFNLGLAFNWRSVNYQATAVDATNPDNTHRYANRLDASTMGLTAEWNILPGRFTPYVNGSLAWMILDTNILAGVGSGCWWDPWWGYVCGNVPVTYGKNTSATSLGLGGRFQFTDAFFVRVGYEHGWIGVDAADGTHMMRIDLGLMN